MKCMKIAHILLVTIALGGCNNLDRLLNGAEHKTPVPGPTLEMPMPIIQPNPAFEATWLEFRAAHPELSEADALSEFLKVWTE